MKKSKTRVNLNINKEDDDFLYSWGEFNERPNKIKYHNSYSKELFDKALRDFTVETKISREVIPADEFDIVNDRIFVKVSDDIFISYSIYDSESEVSNVHDLTFFYKKGEDLDIITNIINSIEDSILDYEEGDDSILNTLAVGINGIDVEPINIPDTDDNIELYYDPKTFKKINKLTKRLKKSDKGITILHGDRGTGKTNIIKYISEKVDRIVIYIPNSLLESTVNSPEFRLFLKSYIKPIIVIDDCESIFNDFYSKSNSYTTNILQMTDGLLSDSIMVNFIMIFNSDIDDIDSNLLSSNNLLDIIEFGSLDKEMSNELSKHLGHNKKFKTKTRLVDIINKNILEEEVKIGLN